MSLAIYLEHRARIERHLRATRPTTAASRARAAAIFGLALSLGSWR